MTDQTETEDAREADDMGEKPDLGRKPDALTEALSGSGMGSDTRAGALQGGAATGSDVAPDQDALDAALASARFSFSSMTMSRAPSPFMMSLSRRAAWGFGSTISTRLTTGASFAKTRGSMANKDADLHSRDRA